LPKGVAYLAVAANISRPLPNRLKGLKPPVINPRIRFFGSLATLATDRKHTYVALPHDRRTHQLSLLLDSGGVGFQDGVY